jgi:hypothetical protein
VSQKAAGTDLLCGFLTFPVLLVRKERLMSELKVAITIVEAIIATVAVLLLGDYLGHKIGRWRLAAVVGIVALVSIIVFAMYAAVVLI